jgi:hypothetical protein
VFRWAVRIGTFLVIWMAFSSLNAQASPAGDRVARDCFPYRWHLWCDSGAGRCGVHEYDHHAWTNAVP